MREGIGCYYFNCFFEGVIVVFFYIYNEVVGILKFYFIDNNIILILD